MRNILLSRWLLSFVGTALLSSLVWVFGPFLAPLEDILPRAAIVVALFAFWAALNLLIDWRARRRDAALASGVTAADPADAASAEEAAALRDKLTRALASLRRARGTRGYLYEQPWYAIIGPPGAGKTTALLNAGLHFPLAEEMGQGALAGVGGTRLCDWWFTDDAVLIDTAGRYTTQDSDAAVDRAGWEAFLDLLKRARPRQPLNGVLVAISLPDVAQAPREERLAHAAAIRRRLAELRGRLGVRLPVYVLFTKADLIAGFSEFFDDLDRETRAQVWGVTFPLAQTEAGPLAGLGDAFGGLLARLDGRLLERLQAERGADRRALIAGFPAQVASLVLPVQEFLAAAFAGSRLDPAPMLRGAYFASGTQEGTPIDRLTGALARSFGLDQRRAPSLRAEQGRSYFLARLLRQVVLGEAMLVAEPPGVARQRLLLRAGGYGAVLLAAMIAGGLLWSARAMNQGAIEQEAAALAAYQDAATKLPLDPVVDGGVAKIAPLLDRARALPRDGDGMLVEMGLSQSGKLAAGNRLVYRHALERVLLPRLVWRLETQMRAAFDRPDFLYEATRIYLMLGGAGPLDRDLVRSWMALDWDGAYPGATAAALRESLGVHLEALLAEPLPPVALDGALVEKARATFSRVKLAQRVYSRIVPAAAARALAPWRPSDALGAAGTQFFVRSSGKRLDEGIPGIYTTAGFHQVLLPSLVAASKQVAAESWVLGRQAAVDPASGDLAGLERDVVRLYEADYAKQWDALLGDLAIAPTRTLPQAAEQLYVLGSPQSPMRDLLMAITHELTLSVPPKGSDAAAVQQVAVALPAGAKAALQTALGRPETAGPPPGQVIDDRYKALRDFVGEGAGAPIELALKAINGVQQDLARLASAPAGGGVAAPSGDDPLLALRAEAGQAPSPVQRWLLAMAGAGTVLRAGGARQQAAAALNGAGGPAALCSRAAAGRYPFSPGSGNDVPLDDFVRLFAPGGLIDAFFSAQLRPFVDTTGRAWTAQPIAGVPAPVSAAELAPFQRAAAIRDMFFPAGATPAVRFEITPVELDPETKQVTLDLGTTSVVYAHEPSRASQISWPAQGGSSARLVFGGPGGGAIQASGPWALFRLIGQGRLQADGAPDAYTLTFQQGGHRAVFAIRAGSVLNPLASGALDFHCPVLR